MKSSIKIAWRTLIVAAFAVWFGGFFFYVSFVIPIGTDVLGTAREQGFITRLVTHRLNLMCAMALVAMVLETSVSWRWATRVSRTTQLTMIALIGGLLVGLVLLHPQMDHLLDVEAHQVLDRGRFYTMHRIYLWMSTFQWIFAWFWLYYAIQTWTMQNRQRTDAGLPSSS